MIWVDVSLFSGRRRRLTQPMLLLVFRMRVTNKLTVSFAGQHAPVRAPVRIQNMMGHTK